MEEVWKDVVGWEDFYQVSNYGNIKAKDRVVFTAHSKRFLPEHLMQININKKRLLLRVFYKKRQKNEN